MTGKFLFKGCLVFCLFTIAFFITACASSNKTSRKEFKFAQEEEDFVPKDPLSFNIIYEFHSIPTFCKEKSFSKPKGKYVYFGDFPQTKKKAGIVINEEIYINRGRYTYYAGSDGNWYAKCLENAFEPERYQYAYSDGTRVKGRDENNYRYFKVEPIKWRVLNNISAEGQTKAVLLAENILIENMVWYDYDDIDRFIETEDERKFEQIYPNNYKHSKVRAYLNGLAYLVTKKMGQPVELNQEFENSGFLQTAFDQYAQDLILISEITNNEESSKPAEYTEKYFNKTNYYLIDEVLYDKLFLLSQIEASSAEFGFAPHKVFDKDSKNKFFSRGKNASDFALANYVYAGDSPGNRNECGWYLRTPIYRDKDYVFDASDIGSVGHQGVDSEYESILPALAIPVDVIKGER